MSEENASYFDKLAVFLPIAVFGFAIIVVIAMAAIGLFDFSTDEAGGKVIAAALSLVGVFFTSVVGLVGSLLKASYDRHSLAIQQEANKRLRMETAINAIGLMATSEGNEAPPTQKAGALFALASLGQMKFALAILSELLRIEGGIHPASAKWLIDKALISSDEQLQKGAIDLLDVHLESFADWKFWPEVFNDYWPMELSGYARTIALICLLKFPLLYPADQWEIDPLNNIYWLLANIMKVENDPFIKAGAARALHVFHQHPKFQPKDVLSGPQGETLLIEDVITEIQLIRATPELDLVKGRHLYQIKKLRLWIKGEES